MARRTPFPAAVIPPGLVGVAGRRAGVLAPARAQARPGAAPLPAGPLRGADSHPGTASTGGSAGVFRQVRPRRWPVTSVPVMSVSVEGVPVTSVGVES